MFTLHNGDCLEYMKSLQPESIDCIVTDPPYGVEYRQNGWDKEIPDWIEVARIVSKTVIFTTAIATLWQYPQPDWVGCWHNIAGASRSKLNGFNHWTPIVIYGKPSFAIDTFETRMGVTVNENKGIDHPSPKPLRLMRWLIENATKEGETVLDPFMGSGTTGVAAVQLQRSFIGCEISPEYFSIAEKRVKSAALQPSLFTPSNTACSGRVDSSGSPELFPAEVIPSAKVTRQSTRR